jgi:hypothetical protein
MRRSNGRGLETGALRTAPALDPTYDARPKTHPETPEDRTQARRPEEERAETPRARRPLSGHETGLPAWPQEPSLGKFHRRLRDRATWLDPPLFVGEPRATTSSEHLLCTCTRSYGGFRIASKAGPQMMAL